MRRFCCALFLCSLQVVWLTACTMLVADGDRLAFVAVASPDDRITWRVAENTVTFNIDSPSGIGRAAVRLVAGDYPDRVVLRFHLAGLEALRFAYDTTVITVAVASTGEHVVRQEHATIGPNPEPSHPTSPDSPYWMNTVVVAAETSAFDPPSGTDRWIEIELPPHFVQGDYTAFEMRWIDFYR